ncbi:MAG: hypothetical protein PHY47_01155 [Lachnospiraceae bacterium]|nr:hypothetical protein [Lachnospiraceae bacterium]
MTAQEFKDLPNWKKVRMLSGITMLSGDDKRDVSMLIDKLTLICLISRVEEGDADLEFLNKIIDKAFGESNDERESTTNPE